MGPLMAPRRSLIRVERGSPQVSPRNQAEAGEEPEDHKRSSNFLTSRFDQRVSSKKRRDKHGETVAEANLMTCIGRLQHDDLKSSQVRRTVVHPI